MLEAPQAKGSAFHFFGHLPVNKVEFYILEVEINVALTGHFFPSKGASTDLQYFF